MTKANPKNRKLPAPSKADFLDKIRIIEKDLQFDAAALYMAVERAEAMTKVFHLKNIERASAESWFAFAWFLERKHPER